MTHEADNLDNAAELTLKLNAAYVSAARNASTPQQVQNTDGTWPTTECECGEQIPPLRLALAKVRCISCQQDFERVGRRW